MNVASLLLGNADIPHFEFGSVFSKEKCNFKHSETVPSVDSALTKLIFRGLVSGKAV
jgi:hypothetical protein